MKLLDDDGDLFGVVNIIDALVLVLVLTAVFAGAALVFQPSPEPEGPTLGTTNATLDLGPQPSYIVSAINEGDTHEVGKNSELTITDVHLTPRGQQPHVVLRVELQGVVEGESIAYADAPPRLGRRLAITTDRYQVQGRIRALGGGDSVAVEEATVVIRDTVPVAEAREVTQGDEIRLVGRTVATVEDVAAYATGDPTERVVFVEATLRTYDQGGERHFGGSPLRRGQPVGLSTDVYTLSGRIERVGAGLDRASETVLLEAVVDTETANRIAEGDVATVAGHETAEIVHVTTYATRNPERRHVSVGVSLQTLSDGERELFGATPIQRGNDLTVDTGDYTFSGRIERVGAAEPRGAVGTRTVTLRMSEVRADMADAIRAGMTEQGGDETIARIADVAVEPTPIIVTAENGSVNVADHPFNREVTLTTELRVRETTSGLRFKGRPLRQGSRVVIDLGTVTVEATVVSVGS